MKPVEILKQAKALIVDPKQWTKGHFVDFSNGGQRYCIIGAVGAVFNPVTHSDYGILARTRRYITECLPAHGLDIIGFNDAPATTHADVMRVMDCAIAKAEEMP